MIPINSIWDLGGSLYSINADGQPIAVDLASGKERELPLYEDQGMSIPHFAWQAEEMFTLQPSPTYHQDAHQIVVRKPNGDEVTTFLLPKSENIGLPKPSPDGTRIAINLTIPELDGDAKNVVTIFNREGIALEAQRFVDATESAWLPDGRLLLTMDGEIFASVDPFDDLTTIADFRRVVNLQSEITDLAVSPTGNRIAVGMLDRIYTLNVDGSEVKQLTSGRQKGL